MNSTTFKKSLSILALGVLGLAASGVHADWGRGEAYGYGHRDEPRFAAPDFAAQVNARQARQMERIRAGFESGRLTRQEFRMLMREQRDIRNMEEHFLADNRIDPREFAQLDRALDVAGQNIREEKHDYQTQYRGYEPRPWYN